jgi:ABC-type polysaccharide/polyol phosphate transport system ATPase subunit
MFLLTEISLGRAFHQAVTKMNGVIAFCELELFLVQPLWTYSSGTMARLGFSVAAHLDPKILLFGRGRLVSDGRAGTVLSEYKQIAVAI